MKRLVETIQFFTQAHLKKSVTLVVSLVFFCSPEFCKLSGTREKRDSLVYIFLSEWETFLWSTRCLCAGNTCCTPISKRTTTTEHGAQSEAKTVKINCSRIQLRLLLYR